MTPEQALQVLKNVLITRAGLDLEQLKIVVQAWAMLEGLVHPPASEEVKPGDG